MFYIKMSYNLFNMFQKHNFVSYFVCLLKEREPVERSQPLCVIHCEIINKKHFLFADVLDIAMK